MKIIYAKTAMKTLKKYDVPTREYIREKINGLTKNPPEGDIKIMQGYPDGRKRLRAGKYRIIYKYSAENAVQVLTVMEIDSRGGIYR